MPVKLSVILDRTSEIRDTLRTLADTRVLAGVPATKAGREEDQDGNVDANPINNAALMYIHENGAPEVNIPARPVVHPAIAEIRKQVTKMLGNAGKLAMDGDMSGLMKQFHAIGILAQNAMRKRITEGPFVPLKPSTIAARRAAGRMGTKPLIDTGQLRRALTYVIRRGKTDIGKSAG